jgi:hypothetical protein
MGSHTTVQYNLDEKYVFTPEAKKRVLTWLAIGVAMFVVGIFMIQMDGGHAAAGHGSGHGAAHGVETPGWTARLYAVLWQNTIFFTGISLIGVFFIAIQNVAWAGWSVTVRRIPETFGAFLPFTFVVMLITFFLGHHDIFHWTHHHLIEPLIDGKPNPHFDKILAGKSAFLNIPFFVGRMIVFFALWYGIWRVLRSNSLQQDQEINLKLYDKSINLSAVFIIVFAVSTSMVAWDWTMSINPHWYSTLFGWYHFASWWVSGLATITLMVLLLKDKGYLPYVNANHLHDLGKFMFAFSVFWTYLWVSQFLLIYYANIPEEIIYFKERMHLFDGHYRGIFFFNIVINFLFPFLFLMTRDAKRHTILLKIAAIGILIGHWLDFYLMIMPGVTKGTSGFGFLEFGTLTIYVSAFVYVVSSQLEKGGLLTKNHPMLQESLHHDI